MQPTGRVGILKAGEANGLSSSNGRVNTLVTGREYSQLYNLREFGRM